MALQPVDIEFVLKGDVEAQLKRVSATVAGESEALKRQVAEYGKTFSSSYDKSATSIAAMSDKLAAMKRIYSELSEQGRKSEFGRILSGNINELSRGIERAEAQNRTFLQSIKAMPGPMGATVSSMEQMTRAAMRFIATPIGAVIAAIVVALKMLTTWFRSSEEGEHALATTTVYFKQILEGLKDPIEAVGKALYDAFTEPKKALEALVAFLKGQFTYRIEALQKFYDIAKRVQEGDWKALFDFPNAFMQLNLGIEDPVKRTLQYAKGVNDRANERVKIQGELNKLDVEERNWSIERERLQTKINELQLDSYDQEKSAAEQRKSLLQAAELYRKVGEKDVDIAKRKYDLTKRIADLDENTKKDNEELANLEIDMIRKQGEKANNVRSLQRRINTLGRQELKESISDIEVIQKQIEKLNKELLTAGEGEQKLIAARIMTLEKELSRRIDIAEEAKKAARAELYGTKVPESITKEIKVRTVTEIVPRTELDKAAAALVEANRKRIAEIAAEIDALNKKSATAGAGQQAQIDKRIASLQSELKWHQDITAEIAGIKPVPDPFANIEKLNLKAIEDISLQIAKLQEEAAGLDKSQTGEIDRKIEKLEGELARRRQLTGEIEKARKEQDKIQLPGGDEGFGATASLIAESQRRIAEITAEIETLSKKSANAGAGQQAQIDKRIASLQSELKWHQDISAEIAGIKQVPSPFSMLEKLNLKVIEQLSEEIRKLQEEASRLDGVQAEELEKKIAKLEAEIVKRKELTAEIEKARKAQETVKMPEGGEKFSDNVKEGGVELDKLKKKIKENEKLAAEMADAFNAEQVQQFAMAVNDVLWTVTEITNRYAEQLGLNEEQVNTINQFSDIISGMTDLAMGNYVDAAGKIIGSIISIFAVSKEEMNVHFEEMRVNIDGVISSLQKAQEAIVNIGSGNSVLSLARLEREMKLLRTEAEALNYATRNVSYGPTWFEMDFSNIFGEYVSQVQLIRDEIELLTKKLTSGNLNNAQRESIEAVLDSYNALISQIDSITQQMTGTTVRALSESLAEAFLNGIPAAEAWGEEVSNIIKRITVTEMSTRYLVEPIQKAIDTLMKGTADGLDTWEAAQFKATMDQLAQSVGPAFAAAREALQGIGIDITSQATDLSPVTGAISAITEESASLIGGQLMATRNDLKVIVQQALAQAEKMDLNLAYLSEIAKNTRYNERLVSIDEQLKQVNVNLKNL
jgi:hypothetical protein